MTDSEKFMHFVALYSAVHPDTNGAVRGFARGGQAVRGLSNWHVIVAAQQIKTKIQELVDRTGVSPESLAFMFVSTNGDHPWLSDLIDGTTPGPG